MANYTYASDIIDDMLFRAGERTDGTSDWEARALAYLNRAYRSIYMGGTELAPDLQEDWWWLRKHPPGVLTLNPVITTGTVSVTNNSTSVTLSASQATSLAGRFFTTDAHEDIYRVSAHTAGTTAVTLDGPFTGATNATAPYKVFQLEYTLASDVLRLISPMRGYRSTQLSGDYHVDGVGIEELEAEWPLSLVESGAPELFAMVGESKVRFNRYGGLTATELIRLEYDYLYRPADLTDAAVEPVIPLQYRGVLADAALMYLLLDKNDNRAEVVGRLAQQGLQAMAQENHKKISTLGRSYGRIKTRRGRSTRLLRTASGLIIG